MRVVARSDAGLAREVNEDYVFIDESLGLVAVADGQGGVVTGVLAARLAVEGVRQALDQADLAIDPEQQLRQALPAVDRMVFDAVQSEGRSLDASILTRLDEDAMAILEMVRAGRGTLRAMHSALALAVLADDEIVVAQVGHCRAYRLARTSLTRLFATRPWWVDAANMLGTGAAAPDVARVRMLDGERLLLCTDGLHSAVDEAAIEKHAEHESLDAAVDTLMERAKPTATDNIALAILEVGGEPLASWRNASPYQKR